MFLNNFRGLPEVVVFIGELLNHFLLEGAAFRGFDLHFGGVNKKGGFHQTVQRGRPPSL